MQILHLTDLHYAIDQPFQKALTAALFDDLRQQISSGFLPDFVVFSGDLVHDPDTPDIYNAFETNFLQPLLAVLSLTDREVVFCPGNHDVSRKAVRAWAHYREQLESAMASDSDKFADLIKTPPLQSYIQELNKGFLALAERCGAPWKNPVAHTYTFPHQNISFVAINSGFVCGLQGSEHDRGKLAIPAGEVLTAFQAVPANNYVISLMHHTLSDLNESATRQLLPIIEKHSSLHFFGHVHNPRPMTAKTPTGSCFMVQGGALYDNSQVYNGYALIYIGPEQDTIAVRYRTYYFDRIEFDIGTNVAAGGVFYSSDRAKSFWQNPPAIATNDDVCEWLTDSINAVIEENDSTLIDRSLLDTFVDPIIFQGSQADENSSSPKNISTDELLRSRANYVIACDAEYGASSLLSYLTMRFHQVADQLELAVVPVLIDAHQIRGTYSAAVKSTIRSRLPESNDPRFKLEPLHESGHITILIDNFDPSQTKHVDFLATLRKDYPRARLIVAVRMPCFDTRRVRPVGMDDFEFLQLRPLTRGKVRHIVEKWSLPAHYEVNAVVDEIHSRFQALGIPMTPVYVVIYLAILQNIQGYNPINSSNVIEQFVEVTLQKYKPAYIFRSAFDYRNQIDYLGAIAEQMCKLNSFAVAYSDLYKWTEEYFDSLGLEHDFEKLIIHFIDNKVFLLEDNIIYFRYNIFLSFFIAHRMQRSDDFRHWLLTEQRYTSYVAEIDIYCGLSRQDVSILEFLGAEFDKVSQKIESYVKPLAWIDRLEKLSLPIVKKHETEAFTNSIKKQLTSNMPAEERDEKLTAGEDSNSVRPDPKRPELTAILPLWILTLRAYTVSLKNLENISKDKKEELFKRFWRDGRPLYFTRALYLKR